MSPPNCDSKNSKNSKDGKNSKESKLDSQAKLLVLYIGVVGCLFLACGMGIVFGWGWFFVVMGLALLLFFALCILGYSMDRE